MRGRLLTALVAATPSLLLAQALSAQAQPVPVTNAKPGWQWTIDSVHAVVNEVRAGRSLQPCIMAERCARRRTVVIRRRQRNHRDPLR
jgi:hypothetical protein